ncbi:histidine kinase, partial [Paenibacillus sepulcri]|nr:histidine kinase [Paenibacillus sepulcri]
MLSSKQSRDLATIAATGRSLSFLINDILDFAKLKNGEVILYRQEVDLPSVVQSVLEVIAHLAGVKDVRFIQDWPENLMLLDTDEERLRQILYNLLGNAVKYTPRGEIRISARAQGAYVRVEVADTGAGIPKERLEDIFQAYDQGSHAGSREYGGTGLGLSITKRLVELGGGQIGVESDSGQGAVFHFTLPAASRTRSSLMAGDARQEAAASLSPDLESDAALPAPAMSKVKEPANNKGTILVVDDNPVNLQVLENLLSITGYKVITAYDGEEALAVIAATP